MKYNAPSEPGGNLYLSEPGTYHFQVNAAVEETDRVQCELQVLSGTVAGQEERRLNISFFSGKLSDRDEGAFRNQCQMALFLAADLMSPADMGKEIDIDLDKAESRQLVMTVQKSQNPKFLECDAMSVWHVDDPRANGIPTNKEALALIPKECRHKASYFDPLISKKGSAKKEPVAAGLTESQLEDL